LYAAAFLVTGIERFSDGIVLSLIAVFFLVATSPFLSIANPVSRLAMLAPLFVPLCIASAVAGSTTMRLAYAAVGIEVLVFGFLFLQAGKAQVTVRGVRRQRFISTTYSFDEIQEIRRFSSRLGRILQQVGLGSTNVELVLFDWRAVRLNVAREELGSFIDEVGANVDHSAEYDVFYLPSELTSKSRVDGARDSTQEVTPVRRRGKKAKKLAAQQRAEQKLPTALR
jgi:hypothetical protein